MALFENSPTTARAFISQPLESRYIYGTGKFSLLAHELFDFGGFAEDLPRQEMIQNKPVVKAENLKKGSIVLVGSSINPFKASSKLRQFGLVPIHLLYFVKHFFGKNLYFSDFSTPDSHYFDISKVLVQSLSDLESKNLLSKLLIFRNTCDINVMHEAKSTKSHYFEDFITFKKDEVFYDIGSYDGENSVQFASLCPNYKQIYFFEPNPRQWDHLQKLQGVLRNSTLVPLAISDTKSKVRFDDSAGTASRITFSDSESGLLMDSAKIDDLEMLQPPTYIKMDIEGNEVRALSGSIETLRKYQPKLAISVYHRNADLPEIFSFCKDIFPEAKFHLRHYSEGTDETVLYCLPQIS